MGRKLKLIQVQANLAQKAAVQMSLHFGSVLSLRTLCQWTVP